LTSVTDDKQLTEDVLARLDATPNDRLRTLMQAVVRHLHGFVSEVQLTEAEWFSGIRFLTAVGEMCDERRQEFILLSDTLGLSSLVDMIAHHERDGATESTVLGPLCRPDAPWRELGGSIVGGGPAGEDLTVRGQVRSTNGLPLAGAVLDIWQTAPNGLYDVQVPEQPAYNLRGRFRAYPRRRISVPHRAPRGRPGARRRSGRHAAGRHRPAPVAGRAHPRHCHR
jgi:catechol 1,2-dioxygenase